MAGDEGRRALLVSLNILAEGLRGAAKPDSARAVYERIVREAQPLGDHKSVGLAALSLGDLERDAGDYTGALAQYAASEAAGRATRAAGNDAGWVPTSRLAAPASTPRWGAPTPRPPRFRRLALDEVRAGQMGYAAGLYNALGEVYTAAGRRADAVRAYRAGFDGLLRQRAARSPPGRASGPGGSRPLRRRPPGRGAARPPPGR